MITEDQEKWLAHFDDTDSVEILPFNLSSLEKFEIVKSQILRHLGYNTEVILRGSVALGIAGKGELDIYVPVSEDKFNDMVSKISFIYGLPKSIYPLDRSRFLIYVENIEIEILVMNKNSSSYINGRMFENYLMANPEMLKKYEKLKIDSSGLSTQKYYRRKIEFINEILSIIRFV